MKARRGFILCYNEATRTMIPFFVKVRSEDIVSTNPVEIDSVLVPTSSRWEESRVENNVDYTLYEYSADWSDKKDPHNETIDPEVFKGKLLYKLYKDGRMEVTGQLVMERIESTSGTMRYSVHLPFAFVESSPIINAQWAYASIPNMIAVSTAESVAISNAELNKENTGEYPFHLNIWMNWLDSGSTASATAFNALAPTVDPLYKSGMVLDDYFKHFTFSINYSGWWRPEKLPDVVVAESFDEGFAGLYKTTGMVAMLSAPDAAAGITVRSLGVGTTVRNHGYYTAVDGVNWLLCIYQATNESGYIREDLLIPQ